MSAPSAFHLRQDVLRVLLTGVGCRRTYLPFSCSSLDRTACVRQLAQLVQAGLLKNDGRHLTILPPLLGWLQTIAAAQRVVRLRAPGTLYPEGCLYPGGGEAVSVLVPAAQPGYVRLGCIPCSAVWQELCALSPALELPRAPARAQPLPCAPLSETERMEGEMFRLQLYRTDDDPVEQLCAVWGEGFYLLSDGRTAVPWTSQAVQARLEEWMVNGI